MNEIWRICKDQALVDIRVPSTDGRGAFQDPTHVSYWNANSFFYYTSSHPAYLQLCKKYGFLGEYQIVSLRQEASDDEVVHLNIQLRAVKYNQLDKEALSLFEELRAINILLSTKTLNDQQYQKLKVATKEILKMQRCSELTVFINSEEIGSDEMAVILSQLMLELIIDGTCIDEKNYPNLLPAPKEPSLLKLLTPRLSFQGSLVDEDIENVYSLLQ